MLRAGRSIRFTATEIDELGELGIDISRAKSPSDFAATLEPWLHALDGRLVMARSACQRAIAVRIRGGDTPGRE